MNSWRACIVLLILILPATVLHVAGAQQTGYGVKKPIFGGSCPTCPWGAMGDIVKTAMKAYGWDVQVCYSCAGGPRAARLVSGAAIASRPENAATGTPAAPEGPVDFGATGAEFLQWAYLGIHDFAHDPEGPRKNIRLIANIQTPTYFVVAVKAGSGITDLRQIVDRRIPVKVLARSGFGEQLIEAILNYYGLTPESVKPFGGTITSEYTRGMDADVILGFAALLNAPEYALWYDLTQKYDYNYLELSADLRAKLVKEFYLQAQSVPAGLLRGADRRVPTVARNGTVVYGRTDMSEDFAYMAAKALDEQQELFPWNYVHFSYNPHTVWKALDIPLHPGAARYYKEKGYMK